MVIIDHISPGSEAEELKQIQTFAGPPDVGARMNIAASDVNSPFIVAAA